MGVINKHVSDEKAAKKHFHVPATLLEVLSAIRQRYQDMEALFSDFHIGDMGMGVVGGWCGCQYGHFVVSRTCSAWRWVLCCQSSGRKKSPVNRRLWGVGGSVEVVWGWRGH